jgi:hypothetical protein
VPKFTDHSKAIPQAGESHSDVTIHQLANMGYGEWRRREDRKAEDIRNKRNSPAVQHEWAVDKFTDHCFGEYRSYQNKIVYNLEILTLEEDKLPYGHSNILRLITVLPEYRHEGYCSNFIRRLNREADLTGCLLMAVCSPFSINVDFEECVSDKERVKQVGYELREFSSSFQDICDDKEFNKKRRGMKALFLESSWEPINIRDGMGDKKNNGYWSFAYVPTSLDSDFRQSIMWRLPKRKG